MRIAIFKRMRRAIARTLINYRGWQTERKIVVFESDDWGSIRMPSKEVYSKFLELGIPVDRSPYCRYDSLATAEDLEALFSTLDNFRDSNNNPPVITANTVVANPDFDKIKSSKFTEYYYENFTDTLAKYSGCENSLNMWDEGIKEGFFWPQFHGREHVNVFLWLELLRQGNKTLKVAFDNKFWGLSNEVIPELNGNVQASFDYVSEEALNFQKLSIIEGLKIFEDIFGYRSESFIANNYIWPSELEKTLWNSDIKFLQGMKYQLVPKAIKQDREMVRHYLGDRNQYNQIYLIRNCVFEPSLDAKSNDSVNSCLNDISNAFSWNKPAIISTHRLNFIGSLEQLNRKQNLESFSELLHNIITKWPSVEFLTSDQLGNIINTELDYNPN